MTVQVFLARFVAGEIKSPFMRSVDGKRLLDADAIEIVSFQTPRECEAFIEALTRELRKKIAKARKAHKPLSGLDEYVKPL